MLKTTINVFNLIKSENLTNLINKYSFNVFSAYKKDHDIDLTFNVEKYEIDSFEVNIYASIDGKSIKSTLLGDDLIPMLDILIKKIRDKSLVNFG